MDHLLLGNYLAHWSMHRYAPLWRIHAVHHSSPVLDWLAMFRSHVLEQLLRRCTAPLLLIALGVSTPAAALASAVFIAWGVLNHSNLALNLRFLEPVLITPRLHHLHHVVASSEQNLGTLFSVWDRLAGRLALHDVPAEIQLGNGDPAYLQRFGRLLVEPFRPRSARRVRLANH